MGRARLEAKGMVAGSKLGSYVEGGAQVEGFGRPLQPQHSGSETPGASELPQAPRPITPFFSNCLGSAALCPAAQKTGKHSPAAVIQELSIHWESAFCYVSP